MLRYLVLAILMFIVAVDLTVNVVTGEKSGWWDYLRLGIFWIGTVGWFWQWRKVRAGDRN